MILFYKSSNQRHHRTPSLTAGSLHAICLPAHSFHARSLCADPLRRHNFASLGIEATDGTNLCVSRNRVPEFLTSFPNKLQHDLDSAPHAQTVIKKCNAQSKHKRAKYTSTDGRTHTRAWTPARARERARTHADAHAHTHASGRARTHADAHARTHARTVRFLANDLRFMLCYHTMPNIRHKTS